MATTDATATEQAAIEQAIQLYIDGASKGDVEIKIEISADVSSGVPDDVVRTVTENAKTLKFDQHGFETS